MKRNRRYTSTPQCRLSARVRPAESRGGKTMPDAVDTRPVRLSALRALPADEPVVMINLLKFNQGGGRERYLQYAQEVDPYLRKVGGHVRYGGTAPVNVIGDGEKPWWDAILIVEYPTPSA